MTAIKSVPSARRHGVNTARDVVARYGLLRRVVSGAVVLVIVSIIVFAATQALPSDPAHAVLGRNATPSQLRQVRAALGLNHPVVVQYWNWLTGIVRGHLGTSLQGLSSLNGPGSGANSVSSLLLPRLASSLELLAIVIIIAVPLSICFGCIAAVRRDGPVDSGLNLVAFVLTAAPEFVTGLLLVVFFSTNVMHWLPAVVTFQAGDDPLDNVMEMVLPVMTLVAASSPYLFRMFRGSMIEALESEYVAMARLKGVPERRVILRHALPNALVPMIQASGLILVYLLSGVVVVESIFDYPGIGTLLVSSIGSRDVPTIQATTLVLAAGVVAFNLLTDVLTVFATPKLRTATR